MDRYTVGSDHVPIICKFGRRLIEEPANLSLRLNYNRANWIMFEEEVNKGVSSKDSEEGVDDWNSSLTKVMWSAAVRNIPKKKVPQRRTMVPWWTEECSHAV